MEMSHLLNIRASFHQHMKERNRGGQANSLSSLSLSLCMRAYSCVSLYCTWLCFHPYGSSEKTVDGTWLPKVLMTQNLACIWIFSISELFLCGLYELNPICSYIETLCDMYELPKIVFVQKICYVHLSSFPQQHHGRCTYCFPCFYP